MIAASSPRAASRMLAALALSGATVFAQPQPPAGAAAQAPWGGVAPLSMPIPPAGKLVAITNATILTASHGTIEKGTILIRDGKIAAIGANVTVPAGAVIIDGTGKFVTPGIIDAHSHSSLEGINEGTESVTSEALTPGKQAKFRTTISGVGVVAYKYAFVN